MDEITVTLAEVNPPALDAALRAALGDLIAGLSAARGELRVHFTRRPSPARVAGVGPKPQPQARSSHASGGTARSRAWATSAARE